MTTVQFYNSVWSVNLHIQTIQSSRRVKDAKTTWDHREHEKVQSNYNPPSDTPFNLQPAPSAISPEQRCFPLDQTVLREMVLLDVY